MNKRFAKLYEDFLKEKKIKGVKPDVDVETEDQRKAPSKKVGNITINPEYKGSYVGNP